MLFLTFSLSVMSNVCWISLAPLALAFHKVYGYTYDEINMFMVINAIVQVPMNFASM